VVFSSSSQAPSVDEPRTVRLQFREPFTASEEWVWVAGLTVTPVPDPPVLTLATSPAVAEEYTAVNIDSAMEIVDEDSPQLRRARVTLTPKLEDDTLSCEPSGGLSVVANSQSDRWEVQVTSTPSLRRPFLRRKPRTAMRMPRWWSTFFLAICEFTHHIFVVMPRYFHIMSHHKQYLVL
jgi:hypothetical protein